MCHCVRTECLTDDSHELSSHVFPELLQFLQKNQKRLATDLLRQVRYEVPYRQVCSPHCL